MSRKIRIIKADYCQKTVTEKHDLVLPHLKIRFIISDNKELLLQQFKQNTHAYYCSIPIKC